MRNLIEVEATVELTSKETHEYLFNTWYTILCKYAYNILKDSYEAEDAVQRVFFQLWDNRNSIRIITSIDAYLYRAVHNTCLNRIKQIRRQSEHNELIARDESDVHNEVYESVIERELDQTIKMALAALPPRCREVFELSRYQMLSYNEIAAALDISPNTVENQIAKALKLLRISLRDFIPTLLLYYLLKVSGLW